MNPIKKISFVGVGNMGNPMAGQLVKKGFDVTVFGKRTHSIEAPPAGRADMASGTHAGSTGNCAVGGSASAISGGATNGTPSSKTGPAWLSANSVSLQWTKQALRKSPLT